MFWNLLGETEEVHENCVSKSGILNGPLIRIADVLTAANLFSVFSLVYVVWVKYVQVILNLHG